MNRETQLVIVGTMTRTWPNQKWTKEEQQTFSNAIKDLDDECAMEALRHCANHEEFRPSIAKFRDHTIRIAHNHNQGYQRQELTLSKRDLAARDFFGPRLTEITGNPVFARASGKVVASRGGMFAGDPDEGQLMKIACNNLIGEWIEQCRRHGWEYVDPREQSER